LAPEARHSRNDSPHGDYRTLLRHAHNHVVSTIRHKEIRSHIECGVAGPIGIDGLDGNDPSFDCGNIVVCGSGPIETT